MARTAARRPVAVATALAALLASGLGACGEGPEEEAERLRAALRTHRAAADSCRQALAREEAAFRGYDRMVDSLRDVIAGLEALHSRGVPEGRYPEYLEAFERYNRSVPVWEARADTLEAHWQGCQEVARLHNRMADSARARMLELGVIGPEPAGERDGNAAGAPEGAEPSAAGVDTASEDDGR